VYLLPSALLQTSVAPDEPWRFEVIDVSADDDSLDLTDRARSRRPAE